ncbi:hypothetical protein EDD22DRAFT_963485 [Suillus occidentalis]|nr:hypothetical protein EDD22DRAFT_963485 [Suillus occidentalis]
MNHKLHVFRHEGQLFTSINASSPPAAIPPIPRPWNPALESDSSSDNIKDVLTTQWAYETRPWFPLIPTNPVFDGAVFGCLNHSFYSLPIESTADGRYILRGDVRQQWETLEHKLLWCQGRLATNMHFPWYGQCPRAPRDYGYLRSHVDATLAKKVALRSRDAFLGISALCTYFIMTRRYRPHREATWTSLLTNDARCPIPSTWVTKLSRTFVGDVTDVVPRTGMIINGAYGLSWDTDVLMFEHFHVPIWVYWPPNVVPHKTWNRYFPSAEDIAAATHTNWGGSQDGPWGIQLDDNLWGVQSNSDPCGARSDGDPGGFHWSNDDPWGSQSNEQTPASVVQTQPDLSCFPLPHRHSGQKHAEDWEAFFARHAMQNKKREEKETPSQKQAHLSRERSVENHRIPGKSSTIQVFEWQPQDEYNGFMLRTHITKAGVQDIWGDYNKFTRIFDSFSNQWDLCLALNPASMPDGDDREDDDDIMPPLPKTAPLDVPPPAPSSFLNDIYTYFGSNVSLSSRHKDIEGLAPILHYYFGYRPTAPSSAPLYASMQLNEWIKKTNWDHLRKLLGDSAAETGSIAEPQRQSITILIAYLVNLKESDLGTIPPDVWDLGPDPSLQITHAHIRISYANLSQRRYYIIEPRQSPNLLVWTLAIPNPITAVMCLRRNWGSDVNQIALALLKRGIAFRTLQRMACAPNFRRPLTELRTHTLGHQPSSFQATYADYVVYEQLRHEFMNRPRARAAFLHGGLVWRLALHSLGFHHLPSILEGISTEAVPFGDLLVGNGSTYYNDGLPDEEIDFMWSPGGPRPNAWDASGLNVGFWSARCEDWFQRRLDNIREGVSQHAAFMYQ